MQKILDFFQNISDFFTIRNFNKSRAEFYDDLLSAFKANISFDSFLRQSQEYAIKLKLPTANAYKLIYKNYMKTQSLTGALKPLVPITDQMVLSAAERSGDMEGGLSFIIKTIGFLKEMKSAIIMAISLPVIMFLALGGMIAGIAIFGIPVMAELMPPEKWTGSGATLLAMGNFVTNYGIYVCLVIAALVYVFIFSLSHWSGYLRQKFDRKFPYNFYSNYQGAMFLISMTALNKGGVSISSSIEQLHRHSNKWMQWHLKKIQKNIKLEPGKFSENFNTGLYSPKIIFRMALASSSGSIESKLESIANSAIQDTLTNIQRVSSFINKLMLAAFAVTLLWVFGTFMMTAQTIGSQAGVAG